MKANYVLISLVLIFLLPNLGATQEPLDHNRRIYVSPEGKVYIQKSLPVYLRISTSPDEDAPSYLLKSEETSEYSNPMYFDTEGWNTIRSPWAVDTANQKPAYPQQDVIFEVYADSRAPESEVLLPEADYRDPQGVLYYDQKVELTLEGRDGLSGLEDIYYSINKASYKEYGDPVVLEDQEKYHLQYYAIDHVRNVEEPHAVDFVIDQTAPATTYSLEGTNQDNILGQDASVKLSSKDTLSGIKEIRYSINGKEEKVYEGPISVRQFEEQKNELVYYAVDRVGNVEDRQSLTSSVKKEQQGDNGNGSFSFYIDRQAPEVNLKVDGDRYKDEHTYVSERSRIKLIAKDDKSGVKEITYSINNSSLSNTYSEPFVLEKDGLQYVNFAAEDQVNNHSGRKTKTIFKDGVLPDSRLSYQGKHYRNRDTVFVRKSTQIRLEGSDQGCGLKHILYKTDEKEQKVYKRPVQIKEPGFHKFAFQAVDQVNNHQDEQLARVFVDEKAPEIYFHFSVKSIGTKTIRGDQYTIYPSNSRLYIAATDMACGTDELKYRINGEAWQTEIPLPDLEPGNYQVDIQANDYLGNEASTSVQFAIEH